MGASESKPVLGGHEELLERFVGSTSVPLNDPFWENLLSFAYPLPKMKPSDYDEATREACTTLALHNRQTSHFGKLLIYLMRSLRNVPSNAEELPLKAVNTVYFTRLFVKHLVEYYDSKEIWEHLLIRLSPEEAEFCGLPPGQQDLLSPTVRSLLAFVADFGISPKTYMLHLEVVNLLLVMSSTQLHSSNSVNSFDANLFIDAAMEHEDQSVAVVEKLLSNFMARLPVPSSSPLFVPTLSGRQGVLKRVGSAAVAVFLLPYYTYAYFMGTQQPTPKDAPLANNSLLLLLALVHYGKQFSSPAQNDGDAGILTGAGFEPENKEGNGQQGYFPNPFKAALHAARDSSDFAPPDESSEAVVKVPFAALFDALAACMKDDRTTLLLYSLLHGNSAFLEYFFVRADLDTLLLPLLEMLYSAPKKGANQMYMLLIILLILTQDSSFNANIHKLILPTVPWYEERLLSKVPLGSLIIIVLIRTVKFNLSKLSDVYLHTNCLATMANMAPHCHHLTSYASQRLISLFHMLAKKYTRLSAPPPLHGSTVDTVSILIDGLESPATKLTNGTKSPIDGGSTSGRARSNQSLSQHRSTADDGFRISNPDLDPVSDAPTELHIYTDFLRIVLEIINAILTYALPRNPEVVYALLHRQELFVPFRGHPRFNELLENIFTVIDFFNARMEDHHFDGEWSVEQVLALVVANTRAWRGDGMKMFTELRFTYEEEAHPEEFFAPYVWTLVVAHSGIPWNPECVTLFPVRQSSSSQTFDEGFDSEVFDSHSELSRASSEQV